jgi:transcriptional regulator with XRE-family HTH domain
MKDYIIDQLKRARTTRNWTQTDMAEHLGMSPSAYARLERGETSIHLELLPVIARQLDVPVWSLIPPELLPPAPFRNLPSGGGGQTRQGLISVRVHKE